ncbi:MAG: hypothetical protein GDA52_10325 [Rhodobacteraceae bacterium]|nr:hypothetical protein [Paracoccaceae bacterium]
MNNILDHARLKDKQRVTRAIFPETMGLRIHRAISWIGRAESCADDHDARFIFLWISFNAVYADESKFELIDHDARTAFSDYFEKIVSLDSNHRIYNALWHRFSDPVRNLMENQYVFMPFWKYHNGIKGYENWEDKFNKSKKDFYWAFKKHKCIRVLKLIFDRLYVLRNQMVHGGSTWNGKVNRSQVQNSAEILGFLMPVFIDIMMDNPSEDWGKPFYPVVH